MITPEGSPGEPVPSSALSRRALLRSAGAAALVPALGGLAACSSGSSSSGGTSKLTYLYLGTASQAAAEKAQFAGFVKANPKIELTAQGIPATGWATFANTVSTRIAGGAAPDVIDIATEGLGIFRSKKLVDVLDSYIAKDKSTIDEYFTDIDPTLKKWNDTYGNPGGTTYYMPGGFNTVCMYCNTEIFQKAGVELPGTDDWTWDDFASAAAKIKSKTGAYILPFGSAQFTDIMPWLLSNGASTLDTSWTKPVINSPQAIESAEYCKMMVDMGYSPKPGGTFDAATQMANGKLAALAGGRWPTIDMLRLKLVDKVQIVKMPKKTVNASPIGWDTFPILSASKNKDAAWTFIKYLTTKASGEDFAKVGGSNIPARKSIATSNTFLDGAPKGSALLFAAAAYATPVPSPNRGAESQTAVEATWLQILTGNVTAAKGLKALSDTLTTLL